MEKTRCLIIGSGPAGYTAAIYAGRANLSPVVYCGLQTGGQLTQTTEVENFPGYPEGVDGNQMMMDIRQQAERFGADLRDGIITEVDFGKHPFTLTTDNGETIEADSVIIATGASAKYLGLDDEKKYNGQGVSACATCDGFFYRKKTVAVVGGGDVAVEDALYLAKFCEKVYLIHRRDSLRAAGSLQKKLFQNEKIEVIWNRVVEEIKGQEKVTDLVLGAGQGSKEQAVNEILPVDGVFIAVGISPNNQLITEKIECDQSGYIKAGEDCLTSIPGVAVVGDLRTKQLRQIITAVADGANAVASLESCIV